MNLEIQANPQQTNDIDLALTHSSLRKVWDLPVRVFHWILALAFVVAYATQRLGIEYFKYHLWSGYTVVVLVSFRIIWGLVGTRHARFWNFIWHPVVTLRYAWGWLRGTEQHFAGHNPLGGLMVVALLMSLLVQAATGLVANDEIFNTGPLYGYVTPDTSLQLTSLHRQLFYWISAAVALHILAVLAHWLFKKENLIKPMFTGHKPATQVSEAQMIDSSKTWLAVLIVGVLVGLLTWLIYHAPVASVSDAGLY